MRSNRILQAALCAGLIGAAPALAQPYTIAGATSEYTSLTTLIPITTAHLDTASSLSGGGQTLTFSTSLTAFNFGSIWTTWGAPPDTEGNPPRVLASAINQTALSIALSSPATTFGFELDPANAGGPHTLTATFYNGATVLGTVSAPLTYNGARVMALSSPTPITSVQISSPLSAGGFALSQFRFGSTLIGAPTVTAIPALGLPGLGALALLLAAAGSLLARHRQSV